MAGTLAEVAKMLIKYVVPAANSIEKARAVYDWMERNIEYDNERKKAIEDCIDDGLPYAPEETIMRRKGICSDMTVLYMALAKEMKLKTDYAHVDIDCNGKEVNHACAIVYAQSKKIQVDVAYKQFDCKHRHCKIIKPKIKKHSTIEMPKRLFWRKIAAAAALFLGIASYLQNTTGASRPKCEEITLLESRIGAKFLSQNGIIHFCYDQKTEQQLKEYVFFLEAEKGVMHDKKILEKYLEADKNNDCTISLEEAIEAVKKARKEYYDGKN